MRSRSAGRVYLLATMIALAAPNTLSQRIALAQIPESPGTFTNSNGARTQQGPVDPRPRGKRGVWSNSDQPTPNPARETIDEMEKARARASGTPVPKSTPHFLNATH
jgi:hypothetical protein